MQEQLIEYIFKQRRDAYKDVPAHISSDKPI